MPEGPVTVTTAGDDTLTVQKIIDEAVREVRRYCHAPQREAKERGITERFCARFEQGLAKLAAGVTRPRGAKRPEQIQERIGKLKHSFGAGQHYTLTLETHPEKKPSDRLDWDPHPQAGVDADHAGCLLPA